jgi:hypothetical protein
VQCRPGPASFVDEKESAHPRSLVGLLTCRQELLDMGRHALRP